MKRSCSLISLKEASASTSDATDIQIDWGKCLFCQDDIKGQKLVCPNSAVINTGRAGYVSLETDLHNFHQHARSHLPRHLQDETVINKDKFRTESAKWHKKCRDRFNDTKCQRAKKLCTDTNTFVEAKHTRSKSMTPNVEVPCCFFCNKDSAAGKMQKVSTDQIDASIRNAAEELGDKDLLTKLASIGDLFARVP